MKLINSVALKQEIANVMPSRTEVFLVIDAMPDAIVRCGYCKYGYTLTDSAFVTCGRRFHDGQKHEADWFCADGEREDEDEEEDIQTDEE